MLPPFCANGDHNLVVLVLEDGIGFGSVAAVKRGEDLGG